MIEQFAEWLSRTSPSILIQTHNAWVIPTVQSIHVITVGVVLASVLMMGLRVLGWAGEDQTLRETASRFGPWLSWGLLAQLVTGALMVVGEPVRELQTFSFWLKMFLLAVAALIYFIFRLTLKNNELIIPKEQEQNWDRSLVNRPGTKVFAIATLLIWVSIVILGRLIEYDHVWDSVFGPPA